MFLFKKTIKEEENYDDNETIKKLKNNYNKLLEKYKYLETQNKNLKYNINLLNKQIKDLKNDNEDLELEIINLEKQLHPFNLF